MIASLEPWRAWCIGVKMEPRVAELIKRAGMDDVGVPARLRELQRCGQIGFTSGSALHRGRLSDGTPVLIKRIEESADARAALTRLGKERELFEALARAGLGPAPLGILAHPVAPSLVLEHRPGELLDGVIARRRLPATEALAVAADLAAALVEIHAARLLCRDLSPANVLVGPGRGRPCAAFLIDLSHAMREGSPALVDASDALPFLSPERTGHLGREVDARSDLYSLGVLLYRLLTGELPFTASDLLGWVHCHVARQPRPPAELCELPPMASDITMRLLAKLPGDRYQSARGVASDLEECLRGSAAGSDRPFVLGLHDVPARFQLPGRLYGRQAELDALLRAFRQALASGSPGVALVAGPSGIGKSSLVQQLRPQLVAAGARFGAGKFDRAQGSPHATLARAIAGLVQEILSSSEEEVSRWGARLTEAMENQGQLLVDLIPQLTALLGAQPPVPSLPPREAQQRFERIWQRFLGALASREHPVVLFLDDLQWASAETLAVVEYVATHPDTHHLFLLGASRDGAGDSSPPLERLVETLRAGGVAVETIRPGPLSREDAVRLVADTLRCDEARCEPLAALLHDKTGGSPFFLIQILSALHEQGLLVFDRGRSEWIWDIDRIRAEQRAEDVASLVTAKLQTLPGSVRRVVHLAACLGSGFDLGTLALIDGRPRQETERDLSRAMEHGTLQVAADGSFHFAHDRVQEAAYGLVPETDLPPIHLRIARALVAQAGPDGLGDRVFDVVSHSWRCASLLAPDERIRLAELELEAGRRVQASTAYPSAARHFAAGQTLLPADCWRSHHALTCQLALERARCEWLSGDFRAAEEWIATLLREAHSRADRAEAFRVRIDVLTTQNDTAACVRTALQACAELFGLEFPAPPTPEAVERALTEVLEAAGGRPLADRVALPDMTDPDQRALQALLSSALPTIYLLDPALHDLVICKLVDLTLRHGGSPHSSHAYVFLALTLGCRLRRWEEAFQFAAVARALADRHRAGSRVATYFLAGVLEHQVRAPFEVVETMRSAWQAAVDGGDANHGCFAGRALLECRLAAGEPLSDVADEAKRQVDFARSVRYGPLFDNLTVVAQLVASLRGGTQRLGDLDGPGFDSAALEARLSPSNPYLSGTYHDCRAFAELLAGNAAAALAASERAAPFARDDPFVFLDLHWLSVALAAAGRFGEVSAEEQRPLLELARTARERLRARAERNPAAFTASFRLVDAELARMEGRDLDAMRGYDDALAAARQSGIVQVEAMAAEAAARLQRSRGSAIGSSAYLRAAHDAYRRWGATAKVWALEAAHPELGSRVPGPIPAAVGGGLQQLDLLAAARASQAISGEINLERLLDTLLRTVMESAGAQSGWLLLSDGTSLRLAAQATVSGPGIQVRVLSGSDGTEDLPGSILAYARRTREPVAISDAAAPNPFSADPALQRRSARSVVCLPIVRRGAVAALLYLENDLVPGAFHPERLALLQFLAAQAAISLELSRHREQLEDLVTRRTEELTRANESLRNANQTLERAHRRLLQTEKMASIGQLAAGIAHEINNPVAYVASNLNVLEDHLRGLLQLLGRGRERHEPAPGSAGAEDLDLDGLSEELTSLVGDTKHGLDCVKRIVQALRTFSHSGASSWQILDVRSTLESTLNLLRKELERKAAVMREYGETPPVECVPSELAQVFMNLLMNAAQAILDRGTITLRTGWLGGEIWIEVSDTGAGIAPENLTRIFDPFFTTKPVGEGTGLGLSVVYGIVEKHHGRIEVASQVGQGTQFRVWLPIRQHPDAAREGSRDAAAKPARGA